MATKVKLPRGIVTEGTRDAPSPRISKGTSVPRLMFSLAMFLKTLNALFATGALVAVTLAPDASQLLAADAAPAQASEAAPKIYEPKWASLDKRPAPQWFLDAKFGIFIHWGLYSVPAYAQPGQYAEWYANRLALTRHGNKSYTMLFQENKYGAEFTYADYAPLFKAEFFNPKEWADLFKKSGAKYVIPTSKHHDGFALWPSKEASASWGRPWNAEETGPKRDLLAELGDAVRGQGLKYGFYYSLYEWHNPVWLKDRERYIREVYHPQFKELVNRYKPALLFGDGEWDLHSRDWRSEELIAWLYNESPVKDEVIINDRWGKETRLHHGGYYTTEYGAGLKDASHAWEENRGIGFSFGLNRAERIGNYKTSRELILVLCDLVSRGGNLLLNIGPAADGTIPPIMEERLLDIGAWLAVNGEAIYGTRAAGRPCQWTSGELPRQEYKNYKARYNLLENVGQVPRTVEKKVKGKTTTETQLQAVKQVFFTQKRDALYAISVGWPEGDCLVLRNIAAAADTQVTLLGHPGILPHELDANGYLTIRLPRIHPDRFPSAHAHTFKITGSTVLPENAAVKSGEKTTNTGAAYTGEQ